MAGKGSRAIFLDKEMTNPGKKVTRHQGSEQEPWVHGYDAGANKYIKERRAKEMKPPGLWLGMLFLKYRGQNSAYVALRFPMFVAPLNNPRLGWIQESCMVVHAPWKNRHVSSMNLVKERDQSL